MEKYSSVSHTPLCWLNDFELEGVGRMARALSDDPLESFRGSDSEATSSLESSETEDPSSVDTHLEKMKDLYHDQILQLLPSRKNSEALQIISEHFEMRSVFSPALLLKANWPGRKNPLGDHVPALSCYFEHFGDPRVPHDLYWTSVDGSGSTHAVCVYVPPAQ